MGSVQEKQDRSKDWALWYSIDNCRWCWAGRRSADVLNWVAEIRSKPVDDLPVEIVGLLQPLKERVVVDTVECCWQVKKCQHHKVAGVLENCRLCRVMRWHCWIGDRNGIMPIKNPILLIPKRSPLKQVEEANQGAPANPWLPGKQPLKQWCWWHFHFFAYFRDWRTYCLQCVWQCWLGIDQEEHAACKNRVMRS